MIWTGERKGRCRCSVRSSSDIGQLRPRDSVQGRNINAVMVGNFVLHEGLLSTLVAAYVDPSGNQANFGSVWKDV